MCDYKFHILIVVIIVIFLMIMLITNNPVWIVHSAIVFLYWFIMRISFHVKYKKELKKGYNLMINAKDLDKQKIPQLIFSYEAVAYRTGNQQGILNALYELRENTNERD